MGITDSPNGLRVGPSRGRTRGEIGHLSGTRARVRGFDRKERAMESLVLAQQVFPEQVTTNQLLQNLVYASGTVGALLVVVGLVMLHAGGVRRANVFNATIVKLVGFFIGFATYFAIGFALWYWQYNEAFQAAKPLGRS